MEAHKFNMRGEFKAERVPTLPTWTSADIGREIYVVNEGKKYYGGSSGWIDYANGAVATLTESYLAILPLENKLPDNGRFGGTGANNERALSDVDDPFTAGIYFNVYNGASIAQAGKFIHDNNDYGGSAGSMTQTTIDLLETQYLRDTNRYGVEYRIAEITAGSGTSASSSFTSGTKYLMTTSSGAFFGFGGWNTFGMWIRCTSGIVGLKGSILAYFTIDGVVYDATDYEITTSDNWVFMVGSDINPRGYDNGMPRFYGTNGNKMQVALPAVFNGLVHRDVYWECPIISNF